MYNILRKNNGFLMVSIYIFAILLIVAGAVFFSQTIHEHRFAKMSFDGLAAWHYAEKGIDYVLAEIKDNMTFRTHTADLVPGTDTYQLTRVDPNHPPVPGQNNVVIDADGNYASSTGDFIIRAYTDPLSSNPNEIIILAKGIKGNATRLIVTKYVASSLFQYFIFTPFDYAFGWKDYDAGQGKIHANGWLTFNGAANISNITEMSTARYFNYYAKGFVPLSTDPEQPGYGHTWDEVFYWWRPPYQDPNTNDTGNEALDYYNKTDGQNFGDRSGLLMRRNTPPYDIVAWDGRHEDYLDPYRQANFGYYMCSDKQLTSCPNNYYAATSITVDGQIVQIPDRLGSSYSWNKYYQLENGFHNLGHTFYHSPVMIDAYHLNTYWQGPDWQAFLNGDGEALQGILMDANTGGEHIEPLSIDGAGSYKTLAQQGGIYIEHTATGGPGGGEPLKVYVNGQLLTWEDNGTIEIEGHTVFEKRNFVDVNSTNTKLIIKFNLNEFKEARGNDGGLTDKIIYSNYPIAISGAESILEEGLTTVCKENVYIHGNYNTGTNGNDQYDPLDPDEMRPSAVITAKDTFTLSSGFYGFAEDEGGWGSSWPEGYLPMPRQNYNYPYEENFYCPSPGSAYFDPNCRNRVVNQEPYHPGYPDGRNWLFDSGNCGYGPNKYCMANPVAGNYEYNLGLVGFSGYQPKTLEQWQYPNSIGNRTTPPSSTLTSADRRIRGAFVRLEEGDFSSDGNLDYNTGRWCDDPPGYSYGMYCRDTHNWGWQSDMTSIWPKAANDHFDYEIEFANGNVPPGDLLGFAVKVILELENTLENWNFHSNEISAPQT